MKQGLVPGKIRTVYTLMFGLAALLVLFCFRWQVVEAARFTDAASSRLRNAIIPALRGSIYAADGTTLAFSEPRYDLFIYLPELLFAEDRNNQSRQELANKLAPIIDTTAESVLKTISEFEKGKIISWIPIAKSLTTGERAQILELTLDSSAASSTKKYFAGIGFDYTSKRLYPEGRLASHVIGLTNKNNFNELIGQGGVEGSWDGQLEPLMGYIQGETDAKGNAIGLAAQKTIEAERGNAIYLTIDKTLQQKTQDKLKWATEEFQAKSASAIIMNPKTGEILTMASYPDYDPNLREENDPLAYSNTTISDPYEVGSVGKVFSLAAAVDSGAVTPETVVINGHAGCEVIHEDLEAVCTYDKKPQPAMAIKDAFALSDNIYFLRMAEKMEKEYPGKFGDYLKNFGVGQNSGIDAQGEIVGLLKNYLKWNIADIAAYSYGHSYEANLVQVASGISAVANNGTRVQPHLVSKVVNANGEENTFDPIAISQVISAETASKMDSMMNQIYKNNIFGWEWYYNDLRNYPIGMKSGTALIPYTDRAGYSSEINATYAGYDISPDSKFVMIVRLEEPQVGDLAGQNARILWLELFREIKDYLGIKPV